MAAGTVVAVRDSRPLSVDVSELLRHPGASLRVRTASRIDGLGVPSAWIREGTPLEVDLRLDGLVDGIHVTGSIGAELSHQCRRCLIEVGVHRDWSVEEIVGYPGDEREDAYELAGDVLDLEPIVRDVIVEDLPFNPLCRPGCRGICPTCGADRNEQECGHDASPVDIRWGPLKDLKDRLEG